MSLLYFSPLLFKVTMTSYFLPSWPFQSPQLWALPQRQSLKWSQCRAERSARLSRQLWWEARGWRSTQETRRWLQTCLQPERTLRRSVRFQLGNNICFSTCRGWKDTRGVMQAFYHCAEKTWELSSIWSVFPHSSPPGNELRWRIWKSANAAYSRERDCTGWRFCG